MKKRILTMLLATLMLVPALLTSCSGGAQATQQGTAAQVEAKRGTVWLRMYAITDERTTDDAVARVEEAVNRLTYLRYKTYLDLKFCTADEYQKAQDDAQAQFDANAAEASRIEESLEASRRAEKAAEKKLSPEELRKKRQQDRLAAKESIRASKAEEQARLDRIARGEEEPPAPIGELQMDLVFIESFDKLVEMIDNERLVSLDRYLEENYTIFSDYIQAAVMAGVKNAGNGTTYAIPTNSIITPEGSFMLFNGEVVKSLGLEEAISKVKKLSDVTEILAIVKQQRPDLIPVEKPVTTIADYDFYGENGSAFGAANYEDVWLNLSGQAEQINGATLQDHYQLMYDWRLAGYFTLGAGFTKDDAPEVITTPHEGDAAALANKQYFMTVVDGSFYDVETWENEGYYVVTHKSPEYTTENSLKTFFGISANSTQKDRAMEILKMMTTDPELKNVLQFGIEDVDYSVNEDKVTITQFSKDYFMDFYGTGNTYIGYIPEEMGADYVSKALEMSKKAKINAFLGYDPRFTDEEAKMYQEMTEAAQEIFQQLCNGAPPLVGNLKRIVLSRAATEAKNKMNEVVLSYQLKENEEDENVLDIEKFTEKFNKTYKPCLALLKTQSDLVRPPQNKVPDFISVSSSLAALTSNAATSAPATTVAGSAAATGSATGSAAATGSAPASSVPASSVAASSKTQA